ncbi:hypothetical protein FCIRC_8368 [Fusarium circinatum]|uniref:Uncharacterized protein n=1 Tax=Fusarium circinatum TaxID=48490 RepID=A0A8H5WWI8_FUSCI|nr:hypothetical protein FCIRC_8368 [Fusarium circinatum]
MSRQSSSGDHLRRSDYESLDQSQDEENLEMQSLQPEGSPISQNVSSSPSESPMTIGFGVWLAIATSFLVLVEAVVFLTWLWFEDRKSEPWRWLMLSGRATQSITLMSVLIRWAIGTLAAITTSMAASIALKLHGVPISDVAEVSVARFTNSGPQSSKKMLPGATFRPWLRILMICLFALVGASQFASTLLVSDLQELTILSVKKNMSYGFNFGVINDSSSPDLRPLPIRKDDLEYWNRAPSQFEIFAEYSEPGESSEELDDTGTVLRAFLPISIKAQRESIQSFNGIARVIDTRAICFCLGYGNDRGLVTAEINSFKDAKPPEGSAAVSLTFSSSATEITSTLAESASSTAETLATETSTGIKSETSTAIETASTDATISVSETSSQATSGLTLFASVTSADTTTAAPTETSAVETFEATTTIAEASTTAMATTTTSEEPVPTDHLLIAGQGAAQGLPLKSTTTNGEAITFGDRTSRWTVGRFVVDDTTGYLTRDGIPVCAKYVYMDRSAALTPCSAEYYQYGTARLVCARSPAAGTALQCSAVKLDCEASGPGDRQTCTVSTEANWTKFFISSDKTVYLGANDLAVSYLTPVDIFVDRAPTIVTPTAP